MDYFPQTGRMRSWACGYKNLQMMVSCLLQVDLFRQHLFGGLGAVPDIPSLQRYIDAARGQGFDPEGMQDLGTVTGTRKWIGAIDGAILFASQGVAVKIAQFRLADGHTTHDRLFEWVWTYFSQRSAQRRLNFGRQGSLSSVPTRRLAPPLYLQHQGHSRTIVGAVRKPRTGETQLVVTDPLVRGDTDKYVADLQQGKSRRILRSLGDLRAHAYQVLYVEPRSTLLTAAEMEQRKDLAYLTDDYYSKPPPPE